MYVADTSNNRIRAVTPYGLVSTLAGSGTGGRADGIGAAAGFLRPACVSTRLGIIYVGDAGNALIRKLTPSGVTTTLAGDRIGLSDGKGHRASFNWPGGLAVDSAEMVYVADVSNNRIRKITPLGVVTTLAGTGLPGEWIALANGVGTSTATFRNPYGVAVDGAGNVFVGDTYNDRIRLILPNGTVSTFAGSGSGRADGTGTSASFSSPGQLSIAANGNLFVADSSSSLVRMITPLGVVTTVAGGGGDWKTYLDGYGTASAFSGLRGVSVGYSGTVYISDTFNNRIRALICNPIPSETPTSIQFPTPLPFHILRRIHRRRLLHLPPPQVLHPRSLAQFLARPLQRPPSPPRHPPPHPPSPAPRARTLPLAPIFAHPAPVAGTLASWAPHIPAAPALQASTL